MLGVKPNGNIILLVTATDERTGLTVDATRNILVSMGVLLENTLNLDGGGVTGMYFKGNSHGNINDDRVGAVLEIFYK